jgi:putative membrane protein
MLRKTMWAGAILAGVGLGSGCSMMGGGSGAEAKAAKGDPNAMFMVEAAHGSHAEIELSQLAAQKATNPRVKEFAQMIVQDHQQGNQQLTQIGQQKGMDVPKRPDELHAKTLASMRKMNGPQFDQAYMSAMVADHEKMLAKFEDKAAKATDPDVRSFASSQVPILRRHLEQARQISSGTVDHSRMDHGTSGTPSNTSGTGTGTGR